MLDGEIQVKLMEAIILAILSLLFGYLPGMIISLIKKRQAKRAGNTVKELEAENELDEKLCEYMVESENLYKNISGILKNQGIKTNELKKEQTLTNLKSYALEQGYEFNKDEWEKKLEEKISLTKQINSK